MLFFTILLVFDVSEDEKPNVILCRDECLLDASNKKFSRMRVWKMQKLMWLENLVKSRSTLITGTIFVDGFESPTLLPAIFALSKHFSFLG